MNVCVDKRTELLNAIYLNSNFHKNELLGNLDDEYTEKLNDFMKKHNCGSLVEKFNKVVDSLGDKFSYDAPITLFLQLDNEYNFLDKSKNEYPYTDRLGTNGNNKQLIDDLMQEVKKFAKESNFDEFYNKSRPFYEKQINKVKSCLTQYENYLQRFLTKFFMQDINMDNFNLNIIMSMASGGYGMEVNGEKIICETGNVINKNGEKHADIIPGGDYQFMAHMCHEISHIFVNPTTAKLNLDDINLTGFDKTNVDSEHEGNKFVYINESVIRAIEYVFEKSLIITEKAKEQNTTKEQFVNSNWELIEKANNHYYTNQSARGFSQVEKIENAIINSQTKTYANFDEKFKDILSNSLVKDKTTQFEDSKSIEFENDKTY